jgi:hypothetical protein
MRLFIGILISILLISCIQNANNDTPFVLDLFKVKNQTVSSETIDSLVSNGVIISTYEESGEVYEDKTYLIIDTIKNALRIESTEAGNSSFIIDEYKVINVKNDIKLIHSKLVGTRAFTTQSELTVYDYNSRQKTLALDTINTKLFEVEISDYFKSNTPDSILNIAEEEASYFLNLLYNDTGIGEYLYVEDVWREKQSEWMKGNTIRFNWVGKRVERTKPFYRE